MTCTKENMGDGAVVVYGEILVIENFIIGGALLYITAKIHGLAVPGKRTAARLIMGSALCGGFSLAIFMQVRAPLMILMEALAALVICFAAFGKEKLWQRALTFLLVTYFMGGVTMALLLLTNHPGIYTVMGIYSGDMKAGLLALFVAVTLFTSEKIIKTVREKKFYQEHIYHAVIVMGEMRAEVTAFFDTGNNLKEPFSGRPVAVAGAELWQRLEEMGMLRENRFCAVPYEAIGAKGVLMGVRMDYIEAGGRRIKDGVVAKADSTFHLGERGGADCELLLSKDMMSNNGKGK